MDAEEASAVGGRNAWKSGVAIDVTRNAASGGFELEEMQKAPGQTQSWQTGGVFGLNNRLDTAHEMRHVVLIDNSTHD